MKKSLFFLFATCLLLSVNLQASAQTPAPTPPPKVLSIFREEVKPARGSAHEKVEVGYVKAFRDAKWPTYYLAMTSITGPSEAWFLVGYDSFDAYEKDFQSIAKDARLSRALEQLDEQDAPFRSGQRAILAEYREDLSYNTGNTNIGQMRYFEVITFRVRPGHGRSFEEARKMLKAAHEKAKVKENFAVYEVASGMPAGTYLLLSPYRSLKEWDTDPHTKEYQDALGDDRQKVQKIMSESTVVVENAIFLFSPKMSYVSEAMAKADPDFWTPKSATSAKSSPATKKQTAKTSAKTQ